MPDDDLGDGCGQGSAALALFGIGTALGLLLTPVRGLLFRMLPHAAWHPGCTH